MWLSKLWFTLTAFAAVLAAALGLIVLAGSNQDLARGQAEVLSRAQDNAQLLFKVNVRTWLDEAMKLATDGALADAAENFGRMTQEGDAAYLHETARTRLISLNNTLKADLMMLLDERGKVVARAGLDAETFGDGMMGYPLVEQVLRGYLRDDSWVLNSALFRLAGSPLFARSRDRIVGAILLGTRVNDDYAISLKKRLGADIVFYVAGKIVGKSLASPVVFTVPEVIREQSAALVRLGHTPVLSINSPDGAYHVAIASVLGEASEQQATYALLTPKAKPNSLLSLLNRVRRDDLALGMPFALLACALAGTLLLGFIFMAIEVDRPLTRLLEETRGLATGFSGKISDAALWGRFGDIGRSINESMERVGKGKAEKRDLSAILDAATTTSDIKRATTAMTRPSSLAPKTPPSSLVSVPPAAPKSTPESVRSLAPPITTPKGVSTLPSLQPPIGTPNAIPGLLDDPTALMEQAAQEVSNAEAAVTDKPPEQFREVYRQFCELKKKCGETDTVSFERFATKLQANRRQLMERIKCPDVKFVVYEKDGRAAVKATPAK